MTRLRWCLGLLGAGALVLVFVVSSFDASAAGKKVSGSGKVIALLSETKMLPGDDPRHEITMVRRTDAERSDAFGEAQVTVVAIADYVAGTGTHRGWRTATSQDGDKRFSAYEGKTRATPKPGGPPEVTFEGKFWFTSGTGKWKGITGGGTYKGGLEGGVVSYQFEGEYEVKQ